jgi:tetratricopeptide (TPR) repeat protein
LKFTWRRRQTSVESPILYDSGGNPIPPRPSRTRAIFGKVWKTCVALAVITGGIFWFPERVIQFRQALVEKKENARHDQIAASRHEEIRNYLRGLSPASLDSLFGFDRVDSLRLAHVFRLVNSDSLPQAQRELVALRERYSEAAYIPYIQAGIAVTTGNYLQAIEDYRATLRMKPELPEVWSNLALLYFVTGEGSLAMAATDSALALPCRFPIIRSMIWTHRGNILVSNGDCIASISSFDSALACHRSNSDRATVFL